MAPDPEATDDPTPVCPLCGSAEVELTSVLKNGKDVPTWVCARCRMAWTVREAEA